MGLKETEERRVHNAFALLANGPSETNSPGTKQKRVYLEFLQRVQRILGIPEVALSYMIGEEESASRRIPTRPSGDFRVLRLQTQGVGSIDNGEALC